MRVKLLTITLLIKGEHLTEDQLERQILKAL